MWTAFLSAAIPVVAEQFLGGDKGGKGQAAQPREKQKTLAQSFMEQALNPRQKESRQARVSAITEKGQGATFQIARLVQQEIEDSYGQNSRAEIERIFGDDGAYARNGIQGLPPSLQETLRS